MKPPAPRVFRCWNCGSVEHKLSDCEKEVEQVNKNFWRKYFRLHDSQERDRHRLRYMNFLLRLDSLKQKEEEEEQQRDLESMTKDQVSELLWKRHLAWRKQQWEASKEAEEEAEDSESPSTSGSSGTDNSEEVACNREGQESIVRSNVDTS